MGFLVKQAGGMISNGKVDLTKIKPQSIHERTPLYVGGEKEIKQANSILGGA
jgi:fructose-1,6-bisphosphatase I